MDEVKPKEGITRSLSEFHPPKHIWMYCVYMRPAVSICIEVSPSYVPGSEYARHECVESSNNITAVFLKKKGKRKRVDRREGGCEMNE